MAPKGTAPRATRLADHLSITPGPGPVTMAGHNAPHGLTRSTDGPFMAGPKGPRATGRDPGSKGPLMVRPIPAAPPRRAARRAPPRDPGPPPTEEATDGVVPYPPQKGPRPPTKTPRAPPGTIVAPCITHTCGRFKPLSRPRRDRAARNNATAWATLAPLAGPTARAGPSTLSRKLNSDAGPRPPRKARVGRPPASRRRAPGNAPG